MVIQIASVFVRQGKAYLPVIAQTETGLFLGIEPVYTADLTLEGIVTALERILAAGHPRVPHPTQQGWRYIARRDPVLRAARVKSWKEFSQHSATYSIEWTERAVTMYVMHLDHLGRADYASATKVRFAQDTPLRIIAEALLEHARSEPGVQAAEAKAK